jgi:hypothetical protein
MSVDAASRSTQGRAGLGQQARVGVLVVDGRPGTPAFSQAAGRSSPRRPAPTSTTGDRLAARACIMNHRTTLADMDVLLAGLRRVAGALDEFR